jgi:cell division protein FtsQ
MKNKKKSLVVRKSLFVAKTIRWSVALILLFATYEVAIRYAEPRLLPIRHIKLNGQCERINLSAIKYQIASHIKGFFTTNMTQLKEDILTVPFVDQVVVKRIWPDTLHIVLSEQQLVARWGNDLVVSSKGQIMRTRIDNHRHLPQFRGPEGQAEKMLQQYNEMTQLLLPFNLSIAALNLNSRRSWDLTLDNGLKILLGRKDVSAHLLSLTAVLPKLKKRHGDRISVIDLRYPNGISVHLKE